MLLQNTDSYPRLIHQCLVPIIQFEAKYLKIRSLILRMVQLCMPVKHTLSNPAPKFHPKKHEHMFAFNFHFDYNILRTTPKPKHPIFSID